VKVVVVEDQLLTREGVVRMLTHVGIEVVGTVGDVPTLLQVVALQAPDAVVLDVRLPPTFTDEGIRAAEVLRQHHPEIAVLVLSHYIEAEFATALLRGMNGGVGYLLKDRILTPSTLSDALNRVAAGECVVDPALVAALLAQDQPDGPLSALTQRERDVLAGVAEGLSNSAIGRRLFISERTVEVHAQRIFRKLGIGEEPGTNRRVLAAVTYLAASGG
jgi:DNA-binding NarL/FixJ family response regulator